MRHVFISYSQKDGIEKAVELQKLFELHGLNPWRDRANIPGGAEWNIEADEALESSYAIVVLATEEAMKSVGVTYEWAKSLGMGESRIKTILIRYCSKHLIPPQFQPLNHFHFDETDLQPRLLSTLRDYKEHDELYNVRIPTGADNEIRLLARKAYSVLNHRNDSFEALERLVDMREDDSAKQILIEGLKNREFHVVEKIVKLMAEAAFRDVRAIPLLTSLYLRNFHDDVFMTFRWLSVRYEITRILFNIGEPAIDRLEKDLIRGYPFTLNMLVDLSTIHGLGPEYAVPLFSLFLSHQAPSVVCEAIYCLESYFVRNYSSNEKPFPVEGGSSVIEGFEKYAAPRLEIIVRRLEKSNNFLPGQCSRFELSARIGNFLWKFNNGVAGKILSERISNLNTQLSQVELSNQLNIEGEN